MTVDFHEVLSGFTAAEGIPGSACGWKLRQFGPDIIIAVSEDKGAYVIRDGKGEPIKFDQAVLDGHAQFGGDLVDMQMRYTFPEEAKSIPFTVAEDHTKW